MRTGRGTVDYRASFLLLVASFLLDTGCGVDKPAGPPTGWADGVRLATPVDQDGDPTRLELTLEARASVLPILDDVMTPVWTYDGAVPGPLLRARKGDRLTVHFVNNLPEASTVHWHGIRLPAAMDGVPDHSQPPVPPGATFDYSFVLPDAGLFWYHPHADSARQVGFGMYGAILVEDPAEPPDLGDEVVLVLSDMAIGPDGSIVEPVDDARQIVRGHEGDTLLVNGRVRPTLRARSGRRQRWRLVNAAKSRYFQLALAGHTFTRLGTDGGLLEAPDAPVDKVMIVPGERADLLVTPTGTPGDTLPVQFVPYDRGFGTADEGGARPLFYVAITEGADGLVEAPLPARLRNIAAINPTGANQRDISLTVTTVDGRVVMGINGVPADKAPAVLATLGQTDVWTIRNTVAFDHPFHFHGFFFQPLDPVTGTALPSPTWRDTFNIPAMQTVKIAVHYDERPGMWMFHCHILDHADAGMMGMLLLK